MKVQEEYFLRLVKAGHFKVFKNGRIKNMLTGLYVGSISKGYVLIAFSYKENRYTVLGHRISYLYNTGKDIPEGYQINHIDFNRSNNNPKNLECVTPRENIQHNITHDRVYHPTGELNRMSLFKDKEVVKYRTLVAKGKLKPKDLIKKYNTSSGVVYGMLRGKTYKHLPVPNYLEYSSSSINEHKKGYDNKIEQLKELANKRGMTQYKASKILDVHDQTIKSWCKKYGIQLSVRSLRAFTESEVEYYRDLYKKYPFLVKSLAEALDVGYKCVLAMLNGNTYKDVPNAVVIEKCYRKIQEDELYNTDKKRITYTKVSKKATHKWPPYYTPDYIANIKSIAKRLRSII